MDSIIAIFDANKFHIDEFQRGDREVFKTVFNLINKPLLSFLIHSFNIPLEFAEDIVAEVFCKLYEKRMKMETLDHIRRWVYVCCKNKAIDHKRKEKTYPVIRGEKGEFLINEFEDADFMQKMEIALMERNVVQVIFDAIDNLPKQRKQVLLLSFFENKTTREIADILGLNTQTVLNHKTRAIKSLKFSVFEERNKYNNGSGNNSNSSYSIGQDFRWMFRYLGINNIFQHRII